MDGPRYRRWRTGELGPPTPPGSLAYLFTLLCLPEGKGRVLHLPQRQLLLQWQERDGGR